MTLQLIASLRGGVKRRPSAATSSAAGAALAGGANYYRGAGVKLLGDGGHVKLPAVTITNAMSLSMVVHLEWDQGYAGKADRPKSHPGCLVYLGVTSGGKHVSLEALQAHLIADHLPHPTPVPWSDAASAPVSRPRRARGRLLASSHAPSPSDRPGGSGGGDHEARGGREAEGLDHQAIAQEYRLP